MPEKFCLVCGKEFGTKIYQSHVHKQKYCSHACQAEIEKRKRLTIVCKVCGKEFIVTPYRAGAKCCSKECSHIYRRKPDNYLPYICEYCGKQYRKHKTHPTSRFCRKQCLSDWLSENTLGENHNNWKGGGIGSNRGRNWEKQRLLALQRDGFKCAICRRKPNGTARRRLAVHHIKPYRDFSGDYQKANVLTNLITLCASCHTKVENGKIYCPIPMF